MSDEEARLRVLTDDDFVNLKRFGFSLEKTIARYPDGVPVKLIAQGLMMTESEVEACYLAIVEKLRSLMGVDVN